MRPPAGTLSIVDNNARLAHRLALALAQVCRSVDGPDFGDLIDDALLDLDPAALADVMWGAQQVAWWAAQRSCPDHDLLGECMHEYRHIVSCMLDGHTVSSRAITEVCRGLLVLGTNSVFVQLYELCSTTDALDVADAFDELNGLDGLEAA